MRAFLVLLFLGFGSATAQETLLRIETAAGTDRELATRERLLELLVEHDLDRWIFTNDVIIDETQIPHSHPTLTLHTRHLGEDLNLISTFIHEQYHWLVSDREGPEAEAIAAFTELFPNAPGRDGGGARDQHSTYLHLIVCDLEFQGMTELFGDETAREVLAATTHYTWIYERVLTDPRIRETNARFGFVVP